MKVRCLIVDDESLARKLIVSFLNEIESAVIVRECKNGVELESCLKEEQVDLIFLDIQMPKKGGLEFLREQTNAPLCILTTAYPQHALEGYELSICDYLLKPFNQERFNQAFQKAHRQIELEKNAEKQEAFILIRADNQVQKVPLSEISFIEGMREYVAYYTSNGRILSLKSLKSLEEELPSNQFMRVHKSFIVAISAVVRRGTNYLLIGEREIPIGGVYKQKVKEVILPT